MRRGFTLVELVAIIVVLAAVFMLAFPLLLNISKRTTENQYDTIVEIMCDAAKAFDDESKIERYNYDDMVKISDLIDAGLVDSNIKNPKTGKSFANDKIVIRYDYPCYIRESETIELPSSSMCVANLEYTGYSQNLTKSYHGIIFDPYTGTNAGEYTITATLNTTTNMTWDDGTTSPKTFKCTIKKANDRIKITPKTEQYTGELIEPTIEVTSGLTPTKTYYSDNTCTVETTPIQVGTYYVKVTTVGNTNYKPADSGCVKASVITE